MGGHNKGATKKLRLLAEIIGAGESNHEIIVQPSENEGVGT